MAIAELLDSNLPRNQLGEGAFWDPEHARLLWVDINAQRVHSYSTADRQLQTVQTHLPVSFVFPLAERRFVIGLADGVYSLDGDSGTATPIALLGLPENHRLNDGKCDPAGRLWIGTINTAPEPTETAALYLLGTSGLREIEGGYTNANGKAWSPDGRIMYHADTARGIIWQYDYNIAGGTMAHKRVFTNLGDGKPDGLATDSKGNLYAAVYEGARVSVFSARGGEIDRIELPVPNPTSCAFGGPDLCSLFITTASQGMDEEALRNAPLSGQVFCHRRDVPGLENNSVKLPRLSV